MTLAGNTSLARGRADGAGTAASFGSPSGVSVNAAGSFAVVVRRPEMRIGSAGLEDEIASYI